MNCFGVFDNFVGSARKGLRLHQPRSTLTHLLMMSLKVLKFSLVLRFLAHNQYSEPCLTSKMERFAKIVNG